METSMVVLQGEEDKGEVVNNVVVVVVVEVEVDAAVVVDVAGVLVRVLQRSYLLKILMQILISTTQEIWRQTEECDFSSQTARGFRKEEEKLEMYARGFAT
jgi:hypothetical protein